MIAPDINHTHNGHDFEEGVVVPLGHGPLFFTPRIGCQVSSKRKNYHLYGVSVLKPTDSF